MSSHRSAVAGRPALGGAVSAMLFVLVLFAFVIESELTEHVQTSLGYRQPFFLFYVVHCSLLFIFPVHVLYLVSTGQSSTRPLLVGLINAVKRHLASPNQNNPSKFDTPFPTYRFARLIVLCTIGATAPALLWFVSVSLASISDVTAIWNTNAFFAYIITVRMFNLGWERRKLIAVVIATLGVVAVVYGGSRAAEGLSVSQNPAPIMLHKAPVIGNLLTLLASVGYGFYQVLYKIYAALPTDPELSAVSEQYERLPVDSDASFGHPNGDSTLSVDIADVIYPPPFGLHPNLLSSAIGFVTLITLWVFLPILDYTGYETFKLPHGWPTIVSIAGIATSGVIFNSGLMILLNVWGPIVVSVGNLLTIVLVFISDIWFGQGASTVTIWSLSGSCAIIVAFGILVYDMLRHPQYTISASH